MKKLVITLITLCIICSCTNFSASAVYSDNFTGTDNIATYSGMQPGFVLSDTNEMCAKSVSSFAFATYKLNNATSISATFYTPICPTATQSGDVAVLGNNPYANVFVDSSGNIITKVGNEWLALAFNENSFSYEFSTPIQTVSELTLTPFLFSIYASSDGNNYSRIDYSISCTDTTVANQSAVSTQIHTSLPQNTEYVRIAISNPPASLISGFFCYLTSVTIGYTEQSNPLSSSIDETSSLNETSSSSKDDSSSHEVSSSSDVSSSDDSSTTKRDDIDKDISSSTLEEDIDDNSSSSKDENSNEDTSSSSKPKDNDKKPKSSSSKVIKSSSSNNSDQSNSNINAYENPTENNDVNSDVGEDINSNNDDDSSNNDDVIMFDSEQEFPISAVIYMSALAIAGVVILIIKTKK